MYVCLSYLGGQMCDKIRCDVVWLRVARALHIVTNKLGIRRGVSLFYTIESEQRRTAWNYFDFFGFGRQWFLFAARHVPCFTYLVRFLRRYGPGTV